MESETNAEIIQDKTEELTQDENIIKQDKIKEAENTNQSNKTNASNASEDNINDLIRSESDKLKSTVTSNKTTKEEKESDISPPGTNININITNIKESNTQVKKDNENSNTDVVIYNLTDATLFNEFIKKNTNSQLFALVCLLTIFPYIDSHILNYLLETLEQILPKPKIELDNKIIERFKNDEAIEISDLFNKNNMTMYDMMKSVDIVNAHREIGKLKIDCVKFSNMLIQRRHYIFKNIVHEFKDFIDLIIIWLLDLRKQRRISDEMIVEALVFILEASIYRLDYIITVLENENLNRVIYLIIYRLYTGEQGIDNEVYADYLDNRLKDWIGWTKHSFICKIPFAFYVQGVISDKAKSYIDKVESTVRQRMRAVFVDELDMNFAKNTTFIEYIIDDLLNPVWENFENFLRLLSEMIDESYENINKLSNSDAEKKDRKVFLAAFFISVLNKLYLEVDDKHCYMPLIANMSGLYVKYYKNILAYIMSDTNLRELLFYILSEYLLEFDKYKKDAKPLFKFFTLLAVVKRPQSTNCIDLLLTKLINKKCNVAKEFKNYIDNYIKEYPYKIKGD